MISYLAWPAALLLGWLAVYFIWIRPLRATLVAVAPSIVKAPSVPRMVAGGDIVLVPPTAWQKFVVMVEGWKTIGLSLVLSIFATVSAVFDALQSTGAIEDIQSMPWASVFKPDVALKIVSAFLVIVPIFHLVGKVKAAMAIPAAGSAKADGP